MFATNLRENSNGKRKHMRLLAILLLTVVTVFFTMGETALAKKKKKNKNKFCTKTAQAAYKACQNEIADDYNIAYGNCINVSDPEERADCYQDAKAELREAKEECKDQLEARGDVCEDLGQDRYDPEVDPVDFDSPLPNPYFPLIPGTTWTYVNDEAGETITVTVTADTKEIEYPVGLVPPHIFTCIVVNDVVTETASGDVIEDTDDWYAQDNDGNVWYFGEIALNYEDGELVDIEGSWTSGVDGAKPGILMWADPDGPDSEQVYRQEFLLGDAEDIGEFVEILPSKIIDGRTYFNVLQTKDYTPIEPDVFEYKYFAPGVGLIMEEAFEDEMPTGETAVLVSSSLPLP